MVGLHRLGHVLGLFLVVLVAGCTGGVEVPEGFATATQGPAAFAYPEDWEVAQQEGGIAALGQIGPGELRQNAILLIDPSFSGDFDTGVDGLNTFANIEFQDRQVQADEAFDVPGAEQARLLTASYRQPGADSTLVDVRQFDLFALHPDGTLYYLQVGGPLELFDEQQFRAILDSFTLDA